MKDKLVEDYLSNMAEIRIKVLKFYLQKGIMPIL